MFVHSEDIYITNKYISDLESKATDALNVSKKLEAFKNDTEVGKKLSGEAYRLLLRNVEMYQYAFQKISKLCSLLANNIESSNNGYLNYTMASPIGQPVDMRKIPELEAQIKQKEKQRDYYLEWITVSKRDSKGNVTTTKKQRDPQKAAVLQKEINELKEIVEYLNKLPNEDGQASSKLEGVSTDCHKISSDISSIQVTRI